MGVLAHDSRRVRTSWIEVAEESSIPVRPIFTCLLEVVPLGLDMVGDDGLVGGLGTAIGIGGANWTVFWNGDHVWKACRVTIDGCRR